MNQFNKHQARPLWTHSRLSQPLKEIPKLLHNGAHPPRNRPLRDLLLRRLAHCEQSMALLVQAPLQRLIRRHNAHLRLQISINTPLAKVRRSN